MVALPEKDDSRGAEGRVAGNHRHTKVQGFPDRDGITVGEGGADDHVGLLQEAKATLVGHLAEAERVLSRARARRSGAGSSARPANP